MASARALRFGRAVIELSLNSSEFEKGMKQLQSKVRNVGTMLTSIGSTGLKAAGGLAALAAVPVKMAANMEVARTQFTSMLGDAAKAGDILGKLEAFALVSPLGVADLQEAAKALLNFGVQADDIYPIVERLGNISGGNADTMKRLAYAFGQTAGKGRLMGGEVLQMVDAGFNPLQEISRTTGESMLALQKRMEAGGISAAEVAKSFETATSEGGRFHGMIEAMANTTQGQFDSLMESIGTAGRSIGDHLLPILREYMADVSKIVPKVGEWIKKNGETIRSVGQATIKLAAYSAGIVAVGTVVGNLASTIGATRIALMAMCGNPVLTGIAALTGAMVLLDQKLNKVYETSERLGVSLSGAAPRALTDFEKDLASKGGFYTDRYGNPILDRPTGYQNGGGNWGRSPAPTPDAYRKMGARANAFGSVPFANSPTWTPPAPPMGPNISVGIRNAVNAFENGMFQATRAVIMGATSVQTTLERTRDIAEETRSIDDEIGRAKIQAMEEGFAKEKAMLDFEHAIRLRGLQEQGWLTDEMQRKLETLRGINVDNLEDAAPSGVMRQREAMFDARHSALVFGGGNSEGEKQTSLLKVIAGNTKPKPNGGGIPVGP